MDNIKSNIKIDENGMLTKRIEIDDRTDADVLAWKARIKTWHMLCSFGRFPEISEIAGIPRDALDYAARFGTHEDKLEQARLYGRYELPYQDFEWQKVRDAIHVLSGRKERTAHSRKSKLAAAGRKAKYKINAKTKRAIADHNSLVTEILKFGYEVFVDAVQDDQPKPSNAIRKARQRRKSGIAARYTREMQFDKFLKEARHADFNIFETEIDDGGLDFDL